MKIVGRVIALALLGVADWLEEVAGEILIRVEDEPDGTMNGNGRAARVSPFVSIPEEEQ